MSKLLDNIKKAVLEEAKFKSDDGVSEVPDVEFDSSAPKTDLGPVDRDEKSAAGKNSKIKSTKKDEPGGKKPQVWGEDEELDDEDVIDEDEELEEEDELEEANAVNKAKKNAVEKMLGLKQAQVASNRLNPKGKKFRNASRRTLDKAAANPGDKALADRPDKLKKLGRKYLDKMPSVFMKKEDLNIGEHLEALLSEDVDLSDEFKEKTKTIFEAAVLDAANAVIEEAAVELEEAAEAEVEELMEATVDMIDAYLEKVVSDWIAENEVALQRSVRAELAESFLHGLKDLFDSHYVHIDEEKIDVVEALVEKVEELEESLDAEISQNVQLREGVLEIAKENLILEASQDLSENQRERLKLLAEGIDLEDEDEFLQKLEDIKEAYFGNDYRVSSVEDDDEPLTSLDEEEDTSSKMLTEGQAFADFISKRLGKKF